MKMFLIFIYLIMVAVFFSACPYSSDVPIDNPTVKINPAFLGNWMVTGEEDETYKVTQKDDYTYAIEVTKPESDRVEKYLAYESLVNGVTFLNLWGNTPEDTVKEYVIYKIELKSVKSISLAEVTDNIDERFSSSKQLKKFISANMKNSYFFNKDEVTLLKSGN